MQKNDKSWIQEFDEKVNNLRQELCATTKESDIYEFGYKIKIGNELFTVTDWGNIKRFFKKVINKKDTETKQAIEEVIQNEKKKREEALEIAKLGQIDGGHHKLWVIDQIVRILTGDEYDNWIKEFKKGEDGDDTYDWDVGIAP